MSSSLSSPHFPIDPSDLMPPVTADTRAYWEALQEGRLVLQYCRECEKVRYPIAHVCPYCAGESFDWKDVAGTGEVFSWARYHVTDLPEFKHLLPYVVVLVQLGEGARMASRLVETNDEPYIGMPVSLSIERWPNGRCVPCFAAST